MVQCRNCIATDHFRKVAGQEQQKPGGDRRYFDDIIAEDKRAGALIHRLRGLLKKADVKYENIDMNDLISSTLPLLHSELIDRRISASFESISNLPAIRGDPRQFQQTLLNLLVKAMD